MDITKKTRPIHTMTSSEMESPLNIGFVGDWWYIIYHPYHRPFWLFDCSYVTSTKTKRIPYL